MRKRYWSYEHDGTGIAQPGQWLDPLMGTAVHEGIEALLMGQSITIAVARAHTVMREAKEAGPILIFRLGLNAEDDFKEAMLLVEALVRGWHAVRYRSVIETYDIIAVERELTVDYPCQGQTIRQLTRPDIILRRKVDGSVFIRNLKTASRIDDKWRMKWRYDMQTFSEALAVESWLGEPVAGTIMEGFVKGSREAYPKGSGDYHWNSPLTRVWKRAGEPPMTEDDWAGRYEWSCTAPHGVGRSKCIGNRNHRLGPGYRKVSVTEFPDGVEGWINHLLTHDRALLEEQFVELTPIIRSPYEIERWKRQALPREVEIREHRDYIDAINKSEGTPERLKYPIMYDVDAQEEALDRFFPMSTADGNCVWPSACPFLEVCWGTMGDDLEGNGFAPRKPNHPQEFEGD